MQQSSSLSDCQERLLCPSANSLSRVSQCTKLFPGNAAYSKSGSLPGLVLASWQCQDYRMQYLWFRRRPKGKRKSLIQRGHPRWKQMQSVVGRELTMVRLWKGAWSKPGFVEEQLQPCAVNSGVKEWEATWKDLWGDLANSDTGTFCLIW